MSDRSQQMPLSSSELETLAAFSRWVDQCRSTRTRLKAARSLTEVITTADTLGFSDLTAGLLIRASNHLQCTGWIWQRSTEPFRDHLYLLCLITLIDRPIQNARGQELHASDRPSSPSTAAESDASPAAAPPTSSGPALEQALEIVRAHGYLTVKPDDLLEALGSDASTAQEPLAR
jgi:hypothetical protein